MNLLKITKNIINGLNKDENAYLIQSLGSQNIKGEIVTTYSAAEPITVQIQTFKSDELKAIGATLRTSIDRKMYLFKKTYADVAPSGQDRFFGRTGDFVYLTKYKQFYKIYTVFENFENVGWVSVGVNLQADVPNGVKASIPQELTND